MDFFSNFPLSESEFAECENLQNYFLNKVATIS
jgi:hypothetical protein